MKRGPESFSVREAGVLWIKSTPVVYKGGGKRRRGRFGGLVGLPAFPIRAAPAAPVTWETTTGGAHTV